MWWKAILFALWSIPILVCVPAGAACVWDGMKNDQSEEWIDSRTIGAILLGWAAALLLLLLAASSEHWIWHWS